MHKSIWNHTNLNSIQPTKLSSAFILHQKPGVCHINVLNLNHIFGSMVLKHPQQPMGLFSLLEICVPLFVDDQTSPFLKMAYSLPLMHIRSSKKIIRFFSLTQHIIPVRNFFFLSLHLLFNWCIDFLRCFITYFILSSIKMSLLYILINSMYLSLAEQYLFQSMPLYTNN